MTVCMYESMYECMTSMSLYGNGHYYCKCKKYKRDELKIVFKYNKIY